jgi:inorganic pyrophosphatase
MLTIGPKSPQLVNALIEIPRGSRNKYEYDESLQIIKLDRVIPSSVMYPTDYGLIPETKSEDGDHLDILVFVSEPTFPGCVIAARPIALANMTDEKGPDPKIIAVAQNDPHFTSIQSITDLDPAYQHEIQHFFETYKDLENKKVTFLGWESVKVAHQCILDAQARFKA